MGFSQEDSKILPLSSSRNMIALSLCGGLENGGPTDDEFEQHLIEYSEICQNPTIFTSPSLVVRLYGKFYSWQAACPIVMTAIAYRKPLSQEAIEQLMNSNRPAITSLPDAPKNSQKDLNESNKSGSSAGRASGSGYSWWSWRRSNDNNTERPKTGINDKSMDNLEEPELSSNRTMFPEGSLISKLDDSPLDGEPPGDCLDDVDACDTKHDDSLNSELADINQISFGANEKYRKSLRLTSEQIVSERGLWTCLSIDCFSYRNRSRAMHARVSFEKNCRKA